MQPWSLIVTSFTYILFSGLTPIGSYYQYFVLLDHWLIFHCMRVPHLIFHSQIGRHLSYFHFLATMNNATVDIHVQSFVLVHIFISPGYIPRVRIIG